MDIPNIQQYLKRCFYFSSLNDEQLDLLAAITQRQHYKNGELIFAEGEPLVAFYYILNGKVQISKVSNDGKEMILHFFQTDDVFADFPFFGDFETYPANALCTQDTEVLKIDGNQFKSLVIENGSMAFRILSRLSSRLKKFNDLIGDLSLRTVESRLAKYLLSVSENTPNIAVLQVHRKTLAAIIGTVPETLSRCFKKLSDDSIILTNKNQVQILNRQALMDIANID